MTSAMAIINLMAIVLPWIELAAGLMLVAGFRARAAALLTSSMMVVFIVAFDALPANAYVLRCFASQGAVGSISL